MLASPNVAEKSWIWTQYDHMVQSNTVQRPGGDAAVMRVKGTTKGIAMKSDVNPFFCMFDPYRGGAIAVAEAARSIAATGARPLAITDCLNFGNPEKPEVMAQFEAAVRGIADACRALDVPVVSGNVSLYNETDGRAIPPTPTVGMVGLMEDVGKHVRAAFRRAGDLVAVLGTTRDELGASEFLRTIRGRDEGPCPEVDLDAEKRLVDLLAALAEKGLVASAHDVSDGGLAVAIAESAMQGSLGASFSLEPGVRMSAFLFGETTGRAVISFAPENEAAGSGARAGEGRSVRRRRLGRGRAAHDLGRQPGGDRRASRGSDRALAFGLRPSPRIGRRPLGPVPRRRGKVRSVVWTIAVLIVVLAASAVWMTQPVFFVRAPGSTGPAPDRARLERRLRKLVEEFHPRDGGHPENMARAAAWIAEELRRSGASVSSQPFETAGARYENVVASYGPDSADVVVVGAHYDVAGEMPGADDNASGVAGLLELGDLLSGAKLSRRVDLVAFALEEAPYFATPGMGSEVYASALERSGRCVRAMLCLEMIGCFTDAPGSQGLPFSVLKFLYPTRGDFIAVVGSVGGPGIVRRVKRSMREASALPVCSINAPRFVHGVDLSDHSTFWKRGQPAVMITDTAFYRNPRYHTEADTPETLDYARMAEVVAGVRRTVLDLAR